jgi:uncharacterized protein (DUF2252 family)
MTKTEKRASDPKDGRAKGSARALGKTAVPAGVEAAPSVIATSDRRAQGKALRQAVPRQSQAGWKQPENRRDPIDILVASNQGRIAELIPIRFGRMKRSPFSFYRGAAAIMATDLATTPSSGLRVQACGDAHLLNFGGFATPERQIVFDINDCDETLPAPWEWDIKRLAASMVVAAQYIGLNEAQSAHAAEATAQAYRRAMANYSAMRALEVWYDSIAIDQVTEAMHNRARVRDAVAQARDKSAPDHLFPDLVEARDGQLRFRDDPPLLYHPADEMVPGAATGFQDALARYRASLPDYVRVLLDRYRLCDVTMKVVGVGSVGTMCLVGLFVAAEGDAIFLQVKEARASVLEPFAGKSVFDNQGHRVVHGQRLMQSASDIFLGWARGENARDFYVRQLRDTKLSASIDTMDGTTLRKYGKLCARALAKAHARSGDAAMIAGYMGAGTTFDEAIREFAIGYADQNERDYRAFVEAVRRGRLPADEEG